MEAEKIIPAVMGRLKTSADRTVRNFEECKDGDNEEVVRKQVVEWCREGIYFMTEPLNRNEKIRAISKIMDEIKNEGQEP